MSELFFSSDLHFGHKFMARLRAENRENHSFPSSDFLRSQLEKHGIEEAVASMTDIMVDDWNRDVAKNDEVYFLGDLSFANEVDTKAIFDNLNGRKYLIKGNHDPVFVERLGWERIYDFRKKKYNGHSFYLMHYPMLTWPNAHKGTYHLHGHTHGNLRAPESTRMDVGPDSTGKIVISADECLEILQARQYDFIDHHE